VSSDNPTYLAQRERLYDACARPGCRRSEDFQGNQFVEQRLRLLQIARIKPFSEPAVDGSEKLTSLISLPLIAPEPRHAHCGTEFPGFCFLLASNIEGAIEIFFCFRRMGFRFE
jgi:hypothetical protein